MHITDLYDRPDPVISFEFFAPKTDAGFRSLFTAIEELKTLSPGFVSVTMGSGGSTRGKTVDLSIEIQREIGLTAMTHLPCAGFSRAEVSAIMERLTSEGLRHVLALRGDPPDDGSDFVAAPDGFWHANELTAFLRANWDCCIGGACYPEVHPEAESAEVDLGNLMKKVDAGADFLITQLFFDNQKFFDFLARARAAGIGIPIVPGVMPITTTAGVRRMLRLGGGTLPPELEGELDRIGEDPAAIRDLGVRWATLQCRELLDSGVPGIHFYTLNRSPSTR
jgi:methylenetetrahydrofolate reductase (NADPH)